MHIPETLQYPPVMAKSNKVEVSKVQIRSMIKKKQQLLNFCTYDNQE